MDSFRHVRVHLVPVIQQGTNRLKKAHAVVAVAELEPQYIVDFVACPRGDDVAHATLLRVPNDCAFLVYVLKERLRRQNAQVPCAIVALVNFHWAESFVQGAVVNLLHQLFQANVLTVLVHILLVLVVRLTLRRLMLLAHFSVEAHARRDVLQDFHGNACFRVFAPVLVTAHVVWVRHSDHVFAVFVAGDGFAFI